MWQGWGWGVEEKEGEWGGDLATLTCKMEVGDRVVNKNVAANQFLKLLSQKLKHQFFRG